MTQTQIGYWTYKESQRHNVVTEQLQSIDVATRQGQLSETIRHNQVTEKQGEQGLLLQKIGLDIQQMNAETNRMNAETNAAAQTETERHNRVMEFYTDWATKIKEYEAKIKEWATSLESQKVDIQRELAYSQISLIDSQIGKNIAETALVQKKSDYYFGELVLKAKEPWQLIGLIPGIMENNPELVQSFVEIYTAGKNYAKSPAAKKIITKIGKKFKDVYQNIYYNGTRHGGRGTKV